MNPFSTASVFLTMAIGNTDKEKRLMAQKATLVSAALLIVFAFLGRYILQFFSITIEAFMVAGGILVALAGFRMLNSGKKHFRNKQEELEAIEKDDISIIPLAIPMLAGPGSLTTAIVFMGRATDFTQYMIVIASILLVCFIAYILLAESKYIQRALGAAGQQVIDKVLGLIVVVVGIQFIINGISGLLEFWTAML